MRLMLSVLAFLAVAAYAITNLAYGPGDAFMRQHLSFKHEALERDCSKCHTPWRGVKKDACVQCHKKGGHDEKNQHAMLNDCASCHFEHEGENNDLAHIPNDTCISCHNESLIGKWKHKEDHKNGRTGVLLTHNNFFNKGVYNEKACKLCHFTHSLRLKGKKIRPLEDMMLKHLLQEGWNEKMDIKCFACHAGIKISGFSASGGGVNPQSCVDCHEKQNKSASCGSCHIYHNLVENNVIPERPKNNEPPGKSIMKKRPVLKLPPKS